METRKTFKMAVHAAEEGGFWANFPELPGCYTQGDTLDELRENAKEAVSLYCEGNSSEVTDKVVLVEDVEITINAA